MRLFGAPWTGTNSQIHLILVAWMPRKIPSRAVKAATPVQDSYASAPAMARSDSGMLYEASGRMVGRGLDL